MGGSPDVSWYDLMTMGCATEECVPYAGVQQVCTDTCVDGSSAKLYYASDAYTIFVPFKPEETVRLIQEEIVKNGPIETMFYVFSDFTDYSHGVYKRTAGAVFKGGHAVKIIGWGIDGETSLPYWLVANSWGTDWGEDGYFRIIRGTDDCSFESLVAVGLVKA